MMNDFLEENRSAEKNQITQARGFPARVNCLDSIRCSWIDTGSTGAQTEGPGPARSVRLPLSGEGLTGRFSSLCFHGW
jgi:hypothetical protein